MVRASSPRAAIAAQSRSVWAAMVGLALLAFAAAFGMASVQARRLARPIEQIEEVALRLRNDAVTEQVNREEFQRSAPAVQDGLFLVPKVIE